MNELQDTSLEEEKHATRKVLLIVEDDPGTGAFLLAAISQETPYHALLAETCHRALDIIQHIKPALFVLDYRLDEMNGLELYDFLHAQQDLEAIPAILLSASLGRLQDLQEEIKRRRLIGLAKPVELDELLLSISQALRASQVQV